MQEKEFFELLKSLPIEDKIVKIKLKYDHEKEYRTENVLLLVDEEVNPMNHYVWEYDWNEGETDVSIEGFINVADVKLPEIPGKWITLKDEWGDIYVAVCSNCDSNGNHKWKYCPNCGAKMEV